jgi:integral membrane protein (TIGR00529 family)
MANDWMRANRKTSSNPSLLARGRAAYCAGKDVVMPAIAKILIVFAGMLVLARVKVPLGLALVGGGVVLNLWAGLPVGVTLGHVGAALRAPDLWLLIAVTVLIIELGRHITRPGNADELMAATRRWGGRHGRAASLMALPAVVGLVPMPAGALFSAPLVQKAGEGMQTTPAWLAAVNYWHRHVWEYWWPLYPGVIVAISLFEMDTRLFMVVQAPFSLVALGAGYFFLVRPHLREAPAPATAAAGSSRRALMTLLPLMTVVGSLFVFPPLLRLLLPAAEAQVQKLSCVLLGLILGMLVISLDEWLQRRRARAAGVAAERVRLFAAVLQPKSLGILFALTGVLLFKSLLMSSDLLPAAGRELVASGIPLAVAVATLPFLAGLVTGIAVGFVAIAFPLVVGLMAAEASGLTPLATLVLAYGFGYMGMMLSPVHLCFLVTREYFGARMVDVYRAITPCILSVAVYALLAHGLLSALHW